MTPRRHTRDVGKGTDVKPVASGHGSPPANTRRRPQRRRPAVPPRLVRVITGGQTGVDRAALDAACEAGIPVGGWCPLHRRAEDGRIPDRYPLHETPSTVYAERTRWNVRDSDGTLIVTRGPLRGGTALTARLAAELARPLQIVDLAHVHDRSAEVERLRDWIETTGIQVLNVAGPRESTQPGIYAEARRLLHDIFTCG